MDLQIEYGPAVEEYQRRLYQFIDHMDASCARERLLPVEQARSTRCACADCRWVVRLSNYHQAYQLAKEFAEGQERVQSIINDVQAVLPDVMALLAGVKMDRGEAHTGSSRPRPAGMKPESARGSGAYAKPTPCEDCGEVHT